MFDRSLKHRFLDFAQVAFWSDQKVENAFAIAVKSLKNPFLDRIQVIFSAGWKAENVLLVPAITFKHHFLDLKLVTFWAVQNKKIITLGLAIP